MAQQTEHIGDVNKMMTAVEWLFEKMTEQGTNPYWDMRLIQAKQMEKEQIITAYSMGYMWGENEEVIESSVKFAEQYYNDTFTSTQST
jgi:hypothetical protein